MAEELECDLFAEQGEERGCLDVSFSFFYSQEQQHKEQESKKTKEKEFKT